MSPEPTNNFSREKLQQLLRAVGSEAAPDEAQTEAVEYDWLQPHYFDSNQLKEIDDFAKRTAQTAAEKLNSLCNNAFNITVESITQQFADRLFEKTAEEQQNNYYTAFGTEQDRPEKPIFCGLVGLPIETAALWAKQLLGDAETESESDTNLSQLEESLLPDFFTAIIGALCDSADSYDFSPISDVEKNQLPVELEGTEPFCKIALNIAGGDPESAEKIGEVNLIMLCNKLEPIAGENISPDTDSAPQDIQNAMLNHIGEIPVSATAQLASTTLTLEQIISLEVNDILLLDKRLDDAIELIVDGRGLFRGRPAKSAGRYAVVINELSSGTA